MAESMTGATSVFDVLRHLISHGPARNDTERAELLGVIDEADPDVEAPDPAAAPPLTEQQKAAAYDELMAAQAAKTPPAAERTVQP
jgi:hypothetical protein